MKLDGWLRRLSASVPRPDPEAEEREENFRRGSAILNELERHLWPREHDDDHLIEISVLNGLANYGLSAEEIDEVAPDFVEQFKDMFRELDAEADAEAS
jgi:hypothetical protein